MPLPLLSANVAETKYNTSRESMGENKLRLDDRPMVWRSGKVYQEITGILTLLVA